MFFLIDPLKRMLVAQRGRADTLYENSCTINHECCSLPLISWCISASLMSVKMKIVPQRCNSVDLCHVAKLIEFTDGVREVSWPSFVAPRTGKTGRTEE